MIRRTLAAAAILVAVATGSAVAGSVEVCTSTSPGPGSTGGVTVREGGVTISWNGGSGGTGGADQCFYLEHP